MSEPTSDRLSSITPSPVALRALAHPVRLRLLGMLRVGGPSTATRLAERLGLNSGATSYHLRQLARHGFVVEDAERGNSRDRWWRAAHQSTQTRDDSTDVEIRDAVDAMMQAAIVVQSEVLQRADEERQLLPDRWRETTTHSDWGLDLTPERAIARYPAFVIDCPDPEALATFYGAMLGWTAKSDGDWAEIRPDDGSDCIAFQQVADYRAPDWPGQEVPQQMHVDLMVHDLDEGEAAVIKLGATKPDHQPGTTFRVFLDPASHPFCLCVD